MCFNPALTKTTTQGRRNLRGAGEEIGLGFRTKNVNVEYKPGCRAVATCPEGYTATGGGYRFFTGIRDETGDTREFPMITGLEVDVQSSFGVPFGSPTSWRVEAIVTDKPDDDPVTLTTFVYCVLLE